MFNVLAGVLASRSQSNKLKVRGGNTSYSNTVVATFNVALPTGIQAGDLLLVSITTPAVVFTPPPAGWFHFASLSLWNDSNEIVTDAVLKTIYKVADGSEGGILQITPNTSSKFSATSIVIARGTYTLPRGNGSFSGGAILDTGGGVGTGMSIYDNTNIPHRDFYPYWGSTGDTLLLSFLGRKGGYQPPAAVYGDFAYRPDGSDSDNLVCGKYVSASPLPIVLPNYLRPTSWEASGTINAAIRGVFPATRPECITMNISSSAGGVVSSFTYQQPTGTLAAKVGDLQVMVVMMYGASGITITPPNGFTAVRKYGSRFAVYKRVVTGNEVYPETLTFSAPVSAIVRTYTFNPDTFDSSAAMVTATSTGTTGTTVTAPAVVADDTWNGKKNYVIHIVVRDGIGGTQPNYGLSAYPTNRLENRSNSYNQGSTGDRVSYAIAAGLVQDKTADAAAFTFKTAVPYETLTLFVKGI